MKVITFTIVALFLIMSAMPVFAATAEKDSSASDTQQPQVSIFQKASDDISSICQDSPERAKASVAIFQKSYDEVAEGAPNAKDLSLRENGSELVKRRKGTPNINVPGVF